METQWFYDLGSRAMSMRARLKLQAANDVTFRVYSKVNTNDGTLAFDGYGRLFFSSAGVKTRNADTRLRLGPGFRFSAGSGKAEKLFVGPVAKKELFLQSVGRTQDSLTVKAFATCEWDLANFKVDKGAAFGKLLLSYKVLKFTERQDLKLTVGTNWSMQLPRTNSFKLKPFVQVRENNWAATISDKGKTVLLSYDL